MRPNARWIMSDRQLGQAERYSPTPLLHKHRRYWGDLVIAYESETTWPPTGKRVHKR